MNRRDVYEEMKSLSYFDAEDYRAQCERHGHSMNEYVRPWNRDSVQNGCCSRIGDDAVRAARAIERREEQREEESQREAEEQQREAQRQQEERWRFKEETFEQERTVDRENEI